LILAVETATRAFSVTLFKERELAHFELNYELSHSQHIVRVVQFLLERLNRKPGSIEAVYAGIGPGSFTGLRIGLSFANTYSQVFDIPLLGVPSLDLLAFENLRWYNAVIPYIRSRKNEVYTALYRGLERKTEYLVLNRDAFIRFVKKHKPDCIAGEGLDNTFSSYETNLFSDDDGARAIQAVHSHPCSRTVIQLAREKQLVPEHRYLKPLYIHGE
jgi:tRNA threonylcarbamoyladenosine biosynthesis protein TsaB